MFSGTTPQLPPMLRQAALLAMCVLFPACTLSPAPEQGGPRYLSSAEDLPDYTKSDILATLGLPAEIIVTGPSKTTSGTSQHWLYYLEHPESKAVFAHDFEFVEGRWARAPVLTFREGLRYRILDASDPADGKRILENRPSWVVDALMRSEPES